MYCKNCGNKINENQEFCTECGLKVQKNVVKIRKNEGAGTWFRVIFGVIFIVSGLSGISLGNYQYIFMLFLGISLYPAFYSFLKIDKPNTTFYQILIPIIFLILFNITNKITDDSTNSEDNSSGIIINEKSNQVIDSKNKLENEEKPEISNEINETKKMLIIFEELGNYGRYEEYENKQKVFYYFPDGDYKIVLTEKNDKLCFLWLEYNKKNKTKFGSQYDVKERLQFSERQKYNYVTMSSDLHIYNSNNCNYELFKG